MIRVILFDLSETVIAGLVGIEIPLAPRLGVDEGRILPAFGGDLLRKLCRSELTEDQYLALVLQQQGWVIPAQELKQIVRRNFHTVVPGMWELLENLSARYELALLSDHGREWAAYIRGVHPELAIFKKQFYSYESGLLKSEPDAFNRVLELLDRKAVECLFVDDNPANVEAAEMAGLRGIWFAGAGDLRRELAKMRGLIND